MNGVSLFRMPVYQHHLCQTHGHRAFISTHWFCSGLQCSRAAAFRRINENPTLAVEAASIRPGARIAIGFASQSGTNPLQCAPRKRGRVVDCTGLENRQRATVREFESHRFRQND
jgi:hypothetical protein